MASNVNNNNTEPPLLEYHHELEPIEDFLKSKIGDIDSCLGAYTPGCIYFIIGGYALYQYYNPIVLDYPFLHLYLFKTPIFYKKINIKINISLNHYVP